MNRLKELQEERRNLLRDAKGIAESVERESRKFTDDEGARTDEILTRVATIDEEIRDLEADAERRQRITDAIGSGTDQRRTGFAEGGNADGDGDERRSRMSVEQRYMQHQRAGRLVAFDDTVEGRTNALTFGLFLRGMVAGDARCRRQYLELLESRAYANSSGTGAELVPAPVASTLLNLRDKYGKIRPLARTWPMSADTDSAPVRNGHSTAYIVAEGVAGTLSNATFRSGGLQSRKLVAISAIGSEVDEDAVISMADFVADDFAWVLSRREDELALLADGSGGDGGWTGLLTFIAETAAYGGHVPLATTGGADFDIVDLTIDDLFALMAAVNEYAHEDAVWLCSRAYQALVFARLAAITVDAGANVAGGGNSFMSWEQGLGPKFLGYPIVFSEHLPRAAAVANPGDGEFTPILGFGSLRSSILFGDRRSLTFAKSTERYFLEDQVAIKATERIALNCSSHFYEAGVQTDQVPFAALCVVGSDP
jgi:HK97 family phage major capsid protein